jgi:multidrug efflux system membrane fusion protein
VEQYRGIVQADQAQIDNARLQLTYCRITSPVTGRIGLSLIDPGNIIHAVDTSGLAVITQVRPIDVIFSLPQDDIPRVLKRMREGPAPPVEAFDRDLRTKLATGILAAIDSQIDPSSGTVRFKATFPNDDEALFPNQFVNARVLVDTLRGTVTVPTAALQRGPQSTFVYVVKPDSTVELRQVSAGPAEGDSTSITSGLAAGETLVTDGVDKLQPGAKVAVQHEPATAPATKPAIAGASP